jgi:hypothetical protein
MADEGELQPNAIYKVSSDMVNMLGKKVGNVADPTAAQDVVTLSYLNSSVPIYNMVDIDADSSGNAYPLNYTVNALSVADTFTTLQLHFPASISPKARDFIIRIEIFNVPSSVTFDCVDGSGVTIMNANEIPVFEPHGIYVMSFTEIRENEFLYSLLQMSQYSSS